MQGSQLPQEDGVQFHVDLNSLTQDGDIQQVASNPERMIELFAKVPNLALLAACFFASTPVLPYVGGGIRHN